MTSHDHLKFLSHGENAPPPVSSSSGSSAVALGGITVPKLVEADDVKEFDKNRSQHQKHVEVVDHLKGLFYDTKTTVKDIYDALRVDLRTVDKDVLEMMKENPKIEIIDENGTMNFRYKAKFEVRNKMELFYLIGKTRNGVSMKDVMDTYGSVTEDVKGMIQSGEIIACKNKSTKDTILYPRGNSFLTKLSGTASTVPSQDYAETTEDLTNEIRRGDAILVGESWFRVSSWINSTKANQPNRAKAPLSVTSIKPLSADNDRKYIAEFTKSRIPLDSGYDGEQPFNGDVFRHGVTNDLRAKWMDTISELTSDKFRDANALEEELLRLKLITAPTLVAANGGKRRKPIVEPNRRMRRRIKKQNARRTNTHIDIPPSNT